MVKAKFKIKQCKSGFGVWEKSEDYSTNALEIFKTYSQAWQWCLKKMVA